ncbi:hypothetical protein IWW54_004655 [Coemansia sp. RSA 2705]|nr:hypothetical protein IWW54_004655 [Coemansia sp. RSA 2705]
MKFALSAIALLASICSTPTRGLEIDLEWNIGEGTQSITTASSLLRFTNDTAPEFTEWIPLGWNYGSMSLQRRDNDASYIVMQLTPPNSHYQAILGKASDISEVKSHATAQGPSQVLLEAKVDLLPSEPYYFKVEAHHDIKQNRTTYEGLYSTGEHWQYLGSLIFQHPNTNVTEYVVRTQSESASSEDDLDKILSSLATSSPPVARAAETTSHSKSDGHGSDSDSDSDSDDSDNDDDNDKGKEFFEVDNSFEDFVRNGFQALKAQARMHEPVSQPSSTASAKVVNHESDSDSDSDSDVDLDSEASDAFSEDYSSESAAADADYAPLNLVKNPISVPEVPAFPRMFSGIKRLSGGDPERLRGGVYKSFELRDRLGETFFISKAHAYLYDSTDSDLASVRHYFVASSYLLTIDGPRSIAEPKKVEETVVEDASESDLEKASAESTSTSTS